MRIMTMLLIAAALTAAGCQQQQDDVLSNARAREMEHAAAARSHMTGKMAPGFAHMNQDGQTVRLSDLKGQWVVLYFYPKDDTPGCSCQANEFTELMGDFNRMNAAVVGVSMDSPASHRQFARKHNLKIHLLSDPLHETMSNYGSYVTTRLGDQEYGHVIRSTFIISPEGRIVRHYPEVIPQGHARRVSNDLQKLQTSH